MGLVLNRPSDIPLSVALKGMEQAKGRDDPIYLGGPVGRSGALALLRGQTPPPKTLDDLSPEELWNYEAKKREEQKARQGY